MLDALNGLILREFGNIKVVDPSHDMNNNHFLFIILILQQSSFRAGSGEY